jgi:tRNA G10  N-methylase Trm11
LANRPGEEEKNFLLTLYVSEASLVELESLEQLGSFNFRILNCDNVTALVKCDEQSATRLIERIGGAFKISKVLGNEISDAIQNFSLPFVPKFNWTVSGYSCPIDLLTQSRTELHELLKSKGLGKSKFIEPQIIIKNEDSGKLKVAEIKSKELSQKIFQQNHGNQGFEFVVHGGYKGKPLFAQTIKTSNFQGYEERDFERPHQDPTKTISPRLARILVNMVSTSDHLTILDPFCGLGTILQEAMLCGYSVIGVDRQDSNIKKSRENLDWIRSKYDTGPVGKSLFAFDARRISKARMPQVDSIATEPILLPIFKSNPGPSEARSRIDQVAKTYIRCLNEFKLVLGDRNGRIAITTPVVVDSSGKRLSFSLEEYAISMGLKAYRGRLSGGHLHYPIQVESTKKRIVHRAINLYVS